MGNKERNNNSHIPLHAHGNRVGKNKFSEMAHGMTTPVERSKAEQMFEGTTIVLRDPSTLEGSEKTVWAQRQENWGRNWEMAGAFLGTDKSISQISREFGLSRTGTVKTLEKAVGKLSEYVVLNPDNRLNASYPEILNQFLHDYWRGASIQEVRDKYGKLGVEYYKLLERPEIISDLLKKKDEGAA